MAMMSAAMLVSSLVAWMVVPMEKTSVESTAEMKVFCWVVGLVRQSVV